MKNKLVIISCLIIASQSHAVEFGLVAGTLGAGVMLSERVGNLAFDLKYTNTNFEYQSSENKLNSFTLATKYYMNNNFYLTAGYVNGCISSYLNSSASMKFSNEILGSADYVAETRININSVLIGAGYSVNISRNLILDLNLSAVQTSVYDNKSVDVNANVYNTNYKISSPNVSNTNSIYPILNIEVHYAI